MTLTVPLFTQLGLAAEPGTVAGYGPVDPALARELTARASAHPMSRFCVTVTGADRQAIGHGCMPGRPPDLSSPGTSGFTVTVSPLAWVSASATVTVRTSGGLSGSPTVSARSGTGFGLIVGGVLGAAVTVTVAVRESTCPPGPLTRTQKVRRGFIGERYEPLVAALYGGVAEADISTEVTFEDGRKGVISARVKICDLAVAPAAPAPGKAA